MHSQVSDALLFQINQKVLPPALLLLLPSEMIFSFAKITSEDIA